MVRYSLAVRLLRAGQYGRAAPGVRVKAKGWRPNPTPLPGRDVATRPPCRPPHVTTTSATA